MCRIETIARNFTVRGMIALSKILAWLAAVDAAVARAISNFPNCKQ